MYSNPNLYSPFKSFENANFINFESPKFHFERIFSFKNCPYFDFPQFKRDNLPFCPVAKISILVKIGFTKLILKSTFYIYVQVKNVQSAIFFLFCCVVVMQDFLTKCLFLDFSNLDDPYAGNGKGWVTEIKDFSSSIIYRKWQKYGNCSIEFLGSDPSGDVHVNDDGTVQMQTPFEMFGGDRLFARNGEVIFNYVLPAGRGFESG